MQNPAQKEEKKNNLRQLKESGKPSKAPPDTYMPKGNFAMRKNQNRSYTKYPKKTIGEKPTSHTIMASWLVPFRPCCV
jgi:hypothetical protein